MAKHDSLRKKKRNEAIREYHTQNPEASLKEIGELFGGISPQRVWVIIRNKKHNSSADKAK